MTMSRATKRIHEKLDQEGLVNRTKIHEGQAIPSRLSHLIGEDIPFDCQAWVDDLIYMISSDTPEQLLSDIGRATRIIQSELAGFGVSLNLKKGKSEAIVHLAGRGSRAVRERLHIHDDGMIAFENIDGLQSFIHTSPKYKYLGSIFTFHGGCIADIRNRTAQAFTCLRQLMKPIFKNPEVSMWAKRHILHTVVMSRMLFNAGSWILQTPRETKCFSANLMKLYRAVFFAQGHHDRQGHYSHEHVIFFLGVCTPEEIMHIHRLRVLITLVTTAPGHVWALLHREGSWLHQLETSISWFKDFAHPTPDNHEIPLDLAMMVDWIENDKAAVRRVLRNAQRSILYHRTRMQAVRHWMLDTHKLLGKAGFECATADSPAVSIDEDDQYICLKCGRILQDFRSMRVHLSKVHSGNPMPFSGQNKLSVKYAYVNFTLVADCNDTSKEEVHHAYKRSLNATNPLSRLRRTMAKVNCTSHTLDFAAPLHLGSMVCPTKRDLQDSLCRDGHRFWRKRLKKIPVISLNGNFVEILFHQVCPTPRSFYISSAGDADLVICNMRLNASWPTQPKGYTLPALILRFLRNLVI